MKSETCKHCGGWEGIHSYVDKACPAGGVEAPIGRQQEYSKYRFFEPTVEELPKIPDEVMEKIRKTLAEASYHPPHPFTLLQFYSGLAMNALAQKFSHVGDPKEIASMSFAIARAMIDYEK